MSPQSIEQREEYLKHLSGKLLAFRSYRRPLMQNAILEERRSIGIPAVGMEP